MNARKFKGQKILAMAVVAMFAFCAFSVCLTDNGSDAATSYNGEFSLNVIENTTFQYKPTLNVSTGTVTLTQSGYKLDEAIGGSASASVPDKTFSKTFGASDTDHSSATGKLLTTTLTAQWTPYVSAPADMIQTATQKLNFHVYEQITLSPIDDINKQLTGQYGADKDVATVLVKAPSETEITVTSSNSNMLTYVMEGQNVKIKTATGFEAPSKQETVTIKVVAEDRVNHDANKAEETYTFTIYEDLTISCNNDGYNTYVGKTGVTTVDFDFNTSNDTAFPSITWSGSLATNEGISSIPEGLDKGMTDIDQGIYTIDFTKINNNHFADNVDKVSFKISVTATGTRTGVSNPETINGEAIFNVYRALEFTKDPKTSQGVVYAASGNPLDILMSADFEGTTKITYNWGDGQSTTVNTNPDAGSKYSARHVYANEGVYVITVTAYNSVGHNTLYTLYDAKNAFFDDVTPSEGEDTNPDNKDDTPAEESFFDKHGYQFIIFAVIAILAFVAFFFFGIQNPVVLIAGIITALLAVLCFVYNDIGGLIEELKALLKL